MVKDAPSIAPEEVEKFSAIADEWWDKTGKFKPLHIFNPVRLDYIKNKVIEHFALDTQKVTPLKGITLLDVGCGGGLLCEPLTQLGAEVTGIDAAEKNIKTALVHAQQSKLAINYQATSAEALASTNAQFDVVLAMEVVEHVADLNSFMKAVCTMVKPGGLLFVATLNRTIKSYMLGIVGAEYVLRWLPIGTHDWKKFLRPSEIEEAFSKYAIGLQEIQGVSYNLIESSWHLSNDLQVNYMMLGAKD